MVVETQPVGFVDVIEDEGGADDDQPDNGTVNSIAATVDTGENDANNDFVEERLGSLSGTVSEDLDNDSLLDDADDAPIGNVTLELFTDPDGDGDPSDGVSVGTTTTDPATGDYIFTDLQPGDYVVVETQPVGFVDAVSYTHLTLPTIYSV